MIESGDAPAAFFCMRADRLSLFAATAAICALAAGLSPYSGIRHDSVLYIGQALHAINPAVFANDLFFKYGSQASFTVFPKLLGSAIRSFPAGAVALVLTAAGLLAFNACSYALISRLTTGHQKWLALVALNVMPHGYGAFNVFRYGEPFLTGRSFAEPAALAGLALLLSNRAGLGLLLIFGAASVHPLQALPALAIWACFQWRWWTPKHLFTGVVLIAVALSFIWLLRDTGSLFLTYDKDWYAWIEEPNQNVFLLKWPLNSWLFLATDLFILWLAAQYATGMVKRFLSTVLWVGIGGVAASFVLVDVMRLVWPAGVQLWRAQWLMHWAAMAMVPALVLRLWRAPGGDRVSAAIVAATALIGAPLQQYTPAEAVLITIPLYFVWQRIGAGVAHPTRRALLGGLLLAVVIAYAKYIIAKVGTGRLAGFDIVVEALLRPLPLWIAVGTGLALWVGSGRAVRLGLAAVFAGAAALSLAQWDRRNEWTVQLESVGRGAAPFGVTLPDDAQVYWVDELVGPWVALQRPSFWHQQQESGLLFNRGTAAEAHRRAGILKAVEFQNQLCRVLQSVDPGQPCAPSDEAIADVCRDSHGTLTHIVLTSPLVAPAMGTWQIRSSRTGVPVITYYLYSCNVFPA